MKKDYERYFEDAGITSIDEQQALLGYMEELIAIAITEVMEGKQ